MGSEHPAASPSPPERCKAWTKFNHPCALMAGHDGPHSRHAPERPAQRPRYAPSSTKSDWIAYSELLEARIKDLRAVLLEVDSMLSAGSSPGPIHERIEGGLS